MVIWVLLHGILWLASGGSVTRLSPRAALVFAGFASSIGYIDAKRRNELLFMGNLGIHAATIPVIWFFVVVVMEILLSWTLVGAAR